MPTMLCDNGAFDVRLATSIRARLRGLLGAQRPKGQLLLVPCHDVHTVGMRYPIDVAFVDANGTVVKAVRGLEPGRRVRCRSACMVLERPASSEGEWYGEGGRIIVAPACADK